MNPFLRASSTMGRTIAPMLLTLLLVGLPTMKSTAAPEPGRVTVVVGEVTATAPGGAGARDLAVGDRVAVGSTIRTGEGARAVIVMTARSAVRVTGNSELVVEAVDPEARPAKVTLDLKSGGLGAMLKTDRDQPVDFQIRTPSGVAAARGTFYAVVVKDGLGYAQVKEGTVRIVPAEKADPQP